MDITRQKQVSVWHYDTETSAALKHDNQSEPFPNGDIANDDSHNKDEDTTMYNDNGVIQDVIFSRDMPGQEPLAAQGPFGDRVYYRWVQQMNMRDFVRIRLNGEAFANDNNVPPEGSRASGKYPWHSRIDLNTFQKPNGNWIWVRNSNTTTPSDNDIDQGHMGIAP